MRTWIRAVALVACGGGGGGKSVTIVQEAKPNPFHETGCKLTVGDVTFDPSITASDDDKKAFSFALKQEIVVARSGIVQDAPGGSAFQMRPTLTSFTPGGDSQLQIDIADASGANVLEQIRVSAKPSSLRDASGFGHAIGRYLKSRFCSR